MTRRGLLPLEVREHAVRAGKSHWLTRTSLTKEMGQTVPSAYRTEVSPMSLHVTVSKTSH